MASKINKKFTLDVTGILDLSDGIIKLEVEDMGEIQILAELAKEFDGKEIKLSIGYKEEL